jgi:abortive infection bacteriophage resistance protein
MPNIMARTFNKSSLTLSQQIAHLRKQGMTVANDARAEHWLGNVSYYRLSAYWLPFEHRKGAAGPRFRAGTDFDTITELYTFDRKLRQQVARAAEHVEVTLRGSWAYNLAICGGSHGYLDASLYSDRKIFHENLGRLAREVGTSPETYIEHYRQSYSDPAMPAVWMVAEMMTFGALSRWYSSLEDKNLRSQIAQPLGLNETLLVPFIKHLVTVRNICAHHGRLWNRRFKVSPRLPHKPKNLSETLDFSVASSPGTTYNSLTMLVYLMSRVGPTSTWRDDMKALLLSHPTGDLQAMGFPLDWLSRPLWC